MMTIMCKSKRAKHDIMATCRSPAWEGPMFRAGSAARAGACAAAAVAEAPGLPGGPGAPQAEGQVALPPAAFKNCMHFILSFGIPQHNAFHFNFWKNTAMPRNSSATAGAAARPHGGHRAPLAAVGGKTWGLPVS